MTPRRRHGANPGDTDELIWLRCGKREVFPDVYGMPACRVGNDDMINGIPGVKIRLHMEKPQGWENHLRNAIEE